MVAQQSDKLPGRELGNGDTGAAQGCAAVFRDLLDDGVAILLVEQDAMFAQSLSDLLLRLRSGRLEPVLSSA